MPLSNDLISQFVKITRDNKNTKKETVLYGTVVDYDNGRYVKIDGSDLLTPYSTTADVKHGDRVTVMIKNHNAVITGNITDPSASSTIVSDTKSRVDNMDFNSVTIDELNAVDAKIIKLTAEHAKFETATVERLNATDARIEHLSGIDANFVTVTTERLDAAEAVIDNLEAGVANIDTLIFGSATGTTIQTSFSNAVIAQLGDAQIKSAMIDSVSASKITAGDISTNNVRILSDDGRMLLSDETIQISDENRVRVQIGKDASNDYSINIWDQNGNLMFSKGGITDAAIKEAIIRNDMVSDTANISAHKLDIDSLFDEINGSTNTIKSTKVKLDEANQTLDVAFKSMSNTVTSQGETITSQGTAISTIQGQITNKIWQQDIDTAKGEMSTQYSTLEQSLNSYKTTVGETYATKTALAATDAKVTSAEATITQLSNKIAANVTETTNLGTRMTTVEQTADSVTTKLDNQIIGGTNLLRATNTVSTLGSSSSWTNSTWRAAGGGTGTRTVINITDAPNPDIKKGFQIVGDDTDTTTAQDRVPVVEGKSYTISCYARGTGSLRLQVGKSPYKSVIHELNNVTTWMKCSLTFVADDGIGMADGNTNVYFGNRGIGTLQLCGFKMEIGNVATDWTPSPFDLDLGITNASRTATDYMSFSGSGLVIGDMTANTLGKNVLIDSDSVDIRNGTTTLASFGADYLYLAKNSKTATIDMCNGLAKLYHAMDGSYSHFVIDTTNYSLSSAKVLSTRYIPLTIETTAANTNNIIVKSIINGVTVGAFGMNSDGYMVRYGSEIAENVVTTNPPVILDTENFAEKMNSSWVNCTLNTETFTRYSNNVPQPQVRKIGKQVYLRGEAKPVTSVTPENDTDTYIATIPSGYRPSIRQQFVMQGSSSYRWLLSVHPDGKLSISRYSNGTTMNMPIAAGAWLCCNAQWLID